MAVLPFVGAASSRRRCSVSVARSVRRWPSRWSFRHQPWSRPGSPRRRTRKRSRRTLRSRSPRRSGTNIRRADRTGLILFVVTFAVHALARWIVSRRWEFSGPTDMTVTTAAPTTRQHGARGAAPAAHQRPSSEVGALGDPRRHHPAQSHGVRRRGAGTAKESSSAGCRRRAPGVSGADPRHPASSRDAAGSRSPGDGRPRGRPCS